MIIPYFISHRSDSPRLIDGIFLKVHVLFKNSREAGTINVLFRFDKRGSSSVDNRLVLYWEQSIIIVWRVCVFFQLCEEVQQASHEVFFAGGLGTDIVCFLLIAHCPHPFCGDR